MDSNGCSRTSAQLNVGRCAHSTCAANELHAFAGEKGIHWRRSRRSASFCRFQGRLSVDMTELRSTATSRILLPMKFRHSLVREAVHWPFRGSPASRGLRAGCWAFACAIVRFPHAVNHSRTFVRLHSQPSVVTLVDFMRYHGRAGGKIC